MMTFSRRKDGSLNLSIQAIVVLVMAMAILGLGLAFIRTLIGQGQSQFEDAIISVELKNPPTADNPFRIDANLKVKSSDKTTFKAGVYNDGTFLDSNPITIELAAGATGCISEGSDTSQLTVKSLGQVILQGSYGSYQVILSGEGTPPGIYICQLEAKGSSSMFEQVTIVVSS